jgi:hypothetical protein
VVDRKEEEEAKEMISLCKKQGKAREGRGVILTRRGTVKRLYSHPLLHYYQYVPLDCASGSNSGAKPSKTTRHLSITREEGAGVMMSGPLINDSSQTAAPFQFPFIVLLHGRGTFFNFNPRRLLQLQILVANFIPRHLQLQSSLPTSSLVANFHPRRLQLQLSSPFNFQTLSLFYFLPFSLMPAVCLMQLLLDEVVTQIIIHSIKHAPVFHFQNLRNKIRGTFKRICDSDEVLLHVSLRDFHRVIKNLYIKSYFERRFCKANHPKALCFEGMDRLMRQRNPDKGLKLIKDAATEDSGAKYFLAMLKYRCNRADPEAIPKHFEPGPRQASPRTLLDGPRKICLARARPEVLFLVVLHYKMCGRPVDG